MNNTCTEKYLYKVLAKYRLKKVLDDKTLQCPNFKSWQAQSEFEFGFIPLSQFILPTDTKQESQFFNSPIEQNYCVI